MYKRAFLSRGLAVILMSGQISGCTAWRVEPLSPADVVERQQPSEVRVQHADGRREVLYKPEVRGDSLLGRRDWRAKHPNRTLMLSDVREVATPHVSGGRTAALVLVVGVVGVIVALKSFHLDLGGLGNIGGIGSH